MSGERDALTAVQELVAKSESDELTIAALRAECTRLRTELKAQAQLAARGAAFLRLASENAKGGDAIEATANEEAGSEAVATPPRSEAGPGRHPYKGNQHGDFCTDCQRGGYTIASAIHQPPDGHEWTGEYRVPDPRVDCWLHANGKTAVGPWFRDDAIVNGPRHILRPVTRVAPQWLGHDFVSDGYGPLEGLSACGVVIGMSGYLVDRCRRLRAEHGSRPKVKL